MARCQHSPYPIGHLHCKADATHFLRDEYGKRIGVWCEEHAREIVTEYQLKLGWSWMMEAIPKEEL